MPLVPGGDSRLHQTDRGLKPSLVVPRDADSGDADDKLFESVLHNPEHTLYKLLPHRRHDIAYRPTLQPIGDTISR